MVMQIAQGTQLEDAFQGKSHGYDRVAARGLMTLIVPGYLILPYLVTPCFEHVMPYLMGTWFIRSKRTSLRKAEECLQCPEFDICWRYSDILNNFTICLFMLHNASHMCYKVMIWLCIFLLLIASIDKYKF